MPHPCLLERMQEDGHVFCVTPSHWQTKISMQGYVEGIIMPAYRTVRRFCHATPSIDVGQNLCSRN